MRNIFTVVKNQELKELVADFVSDSIEANQKVTIAAKFDYEGLPKFASDTRFQILHQVEGEPKNKLGATFYDKFKNFRV